MEQVHDSNTHWGPLDAEIVDEASNTYFGMPRFAGSTASPGQPNITETIVSQADQPSA